MRAERLTDPLAHHGEGPIWDSRTDRLIWVDMLQGDLLSCAADGSEVERRHVSDVAACVVPRAAGGHVVATERGFALLNPAGDASALPDVWTDPTVRMNDGACDPQGRFWCGSMAYGAAAGRGALYRLGADLTVETLLPSVTISNGLGWSPDGQTGYYIDSTTQQVAAFGTEIGERWTLVEIPESSGTPDGLTVDADGGIWVALWGGSAVHRYSPDGRLDAVVEVPVRQPTSCAFGGADLSTLYISTSASELSDPEPEAGAVFVVRPGTTGLPTLEFAG